MAGVQIAAFGWEHAVILLENGCIHIRSLPAAEGRDGEKAATLASSRALSIPEAATAIAAGEQHRYCVLLLCSLTLTLAAGSASQKIVR